MDGFKPKQDRLTRQRPPIGGLSARLRRKRTTGPFIGLASVSATFASAAAIFPAAIAAYQAASEMADRLTKARARQSDLPVAYIKLGDMLMAQGNLAEALTSYRKGLAIIERLAKADPDNTGWQRDLLASYGRVGLVLAQQGESILARDTFYRARSIVAQLKDQFADDAQLPQAIVTFDAEIAKLEQAQAAERGIAQPEQAAQ